MALRDCCLTCWCCFAPQSISAGGHHSCGVTTTGQGLCWGYNAQGQTTVPSGHTWLVRPSPPHPTPLDAHSVGARVAHDWPCMALSMLRPRHDSPRCTMQCTHTQGWRGI